jgi:hypothetical protein
LKKDEKEIIADDSFTVLIFTLKRNTIVLYLNDFGIITIDRKIYRNETFIILANQESNILIMPLYVNYIIFYDNYVTSTEPEDCKFALY